MKPKELIKSWKLKDGT